MAGVVLQHGRCHFLVKCQIPFIAVVLELHILFLGIAFRSLQLDGSARKVEGSLEKLRCPPERFVPVGLGQCRLPACLIEFTQLGEIYAYSRVFHGFGIKPLLYLGFVFRLLPDKTDGVDTFVHTHRVLPVVGRADILVLILDAGLFILVHVFLHDGELDVTHLYTGRIVDVTTPLYTVGRQIATGRTRITHGHGKVLVFVAFKAYRRPVSRMVRYIVF